MRTKKSKEKKAFSQIGATAIALLLAVVAIYGVYIFYSYSSSLSSHLIGTQNLFRNNNNQAASTSNIVNVHGNATEEEGPQECGGGFYPVEVTFTSSLGTNYSSTVTNPQGSPTGNYSANLPRNDQYNVTVMAKNHCVPNANPQSCYAGTLIVGSNVASEDVNLECGKSLTIVSSSVTSSSTTNVAVANSTTSANTQIDSACITQATLSTTAASTTLSTTSTSSSTSTSSLPCSVLKTLANKGELLTNPPVNGTTFFFGAYFNFTKDTTATNFTLTGSFTSNSNFTLLISYGSSTHGTESLEATQESNGNYTLNLNQQVPIGPHYNYQITMVFTPYAPKQTALVTSDFNIVTCAPAQLQMFGIT